MSDDQFTKLFKYIEEFRHSIEVKLDEKASQKSVDSLTNSVDSYAAKLDTYTMEMAALDHKMSRLEKYIQLLAAKAGVDLDGIHI